MATRTVTLTEDEWRLISIWANNAHHDIDRQRIRELPDSPQEKAAEADQKFIQQIMAKLAGRA